MIVTVTPNPAIDRTVLIRDFTIGATNRAIAERTEIGGKGINVARHLMSLGCDVLATGLLGSRDMHGIVETLARQGVRTDFVRVAGDTRVNIKILDPATGEETEINEAGPSLAADAADVLLAKLRALLPTCEVMVLSGSLPPGVPDDLYARAIALAADAGVKTVLDAAGAALRLGIAARPNLVKPNHAEAEELLGAPLRDEGELEAAAREFRDRGAQSAVISLGSAGAVCAAPAGSWLAKPPRIVPRHTVGAGDAMVASLACSLMRGVPAPEALRLATALGSATAASDAPLPRIGDFEALLPDVSVEAFPRQTSYRAART
jgi:1-phosphofructokinase